MRWDLIRRSYEYRLATTVYVIFFIIASAILVFFGALWALLPAIMVGYSLGRMYAVEQEVSKSDPLNLLAELVDPDPCWFDHHGYCQAHSLHEKPCPHERAKELLNATRNET